MQQTTCCDGEKHEVAVSKYSSARRYPYAHQGIPDFHTETASGCNHDAVWLEHTVAPADRTKGRGIGRQDPGRSLTPFEQLVLRRAAHPAYTGPVPVEHGKHRKIEDQKK